MDWSSIQKILTIIQHTVSVFGIVIIISGIIYAICRYGYFISKGHITKHGEKLNTVRLDLARFLLLGLEVIVAGDLIGSITTPDYYEVGILAIIVAIRTLLSYSISQELKTIKE